MCFFYGDKSICSFDPLKIAPIVKYTSFEKTMKNISKLLGVFFSDNLTKQRF